MVKYGLDKGIHTTAYAPLSSPTTMSKTGRHVPNLLQVLSPHRPQAASELM